MARVQRIFWDQNNNPVYGIPGYEIKGSKDVTAETIQLERLDFNN